MEKQSINSEKVRSIGRNYWLDHRRSEKGTDYLVIAESKKGEDGNYETTRIIIFDDAVDSFKAALNRLVEKFHQKRVDS